MRRAGLLAAGLLAGVSGAAHAQAIPDAKITAVFTPATRAFLCRADSPGVRVAPMLGELAKTYSLNPFALPPPPAAAASTPTAEAAFAGWILASADLIQAEAMEAGISATLHETLTQIRSGLVEYVQSIRGAAPSASFRAGPEAGAAGTAAEQKLLLERLLAPVLGVATSQAVIECGPAPAPTTPARDGPSSFGPGPGSREAAPPGGVIAFRGRIDDLAVPRLAPGAQTPGEAYKKASDATLAFTDNDQKGEESVAIEAVLGWGRNLTRTDSVFGFIHYVETSTETDASGDDDDSKDIRALSPGILFRHPIGPSNTPGLIYGTLGVTAYPTYNFAQDSETLRARVFLNDISLDLGGAGPLCDITGQVGPLQWTCRLGVSAEWTHVVEAGRSLDLATLDDDQFFGVGGEIALGLSLPDNEALAPFLLTAEYRYLGIVSGGLDDPDRLSISLTYKVPKSNVSIGLTRIDGVNFETLQPEEQTKVSVGFRY
ncbi:MAG: hypothetical protein PSV23_15925 [Brevundimonas sp.]|uniref:hypothetical protein n=1 Tax=Brevundimonas sp. TaxID=1871086 RepID=UPI00248789CF|nr:hypothetical protein [Brevundimonas sp.]MDI1328282.1 hypothetical protein [Brevundimonas sp.]